MLHHPVLAPLFFQPVKSFPLKRDTQALFGQDWIAPQITSSNSTAAARNRLPVCPSKTSIYACARSRGAWAKENYSQIQRSSSPVSFAHPMVIARVVDSIRPFVSQASKSRIPQLRQVAGSALENLFHEGDRAFNFHYSPDAMSSASSVEEVTTGIPFRKRARGIPRGRVHNSLALMKKQGPMQACAQPRGRPNDIRDLRGGPTVPITGSPERQIVTKLLCVAFSCAARACSGTETQRKQWHRCRNGQKCHLVASGHPKKPKPRIAAMVVSH